MVRTLPFFGHVTPKSRQAFLVGTTLSIRMSHYERDPRNREACIRRYGAQYSPCGFNFERVYGPLGKEYINVHHLHPLGTAGGRHLVDPAEDIKPLCPNCHAMVHRSKGLLTTEELQDQIKQARNQGNL